MLLSVSIYTYLYNMILSEETLRYPASYYFPSPLIHTSTIWYCTGMYKWRRTITWCWIFECFFWQYHIVQVCIHGERQYHNAGYLSISSDNILLYRYVFWVLDHYIILSFDLYHVSIMHMHVRTLLSDDGSVVSVTRKEQQLEQTCLTICFFVVVLFCYGFLFLFCLFVCVGF